MHDMATPWRPHTRFRRQLLSPPFRAALQADDSCFCTHAPVIRRQHPSIGQTWPTQSLQAMPQSLQKRHYLSIQIHRRRGAPHYFGVHPVLRVEGRNGAHGTHDSEMGRRVSYRHVRVLASARACSSLQDPFGGVASARDLCSCTRLLIDGEWP